MYLITLDGKLHLAPLNNPQNVLDLGTGNGIWAMYVRAPLPCSQQLTNHAHASDMADAYPSAHVVGTDLSAIQLPYIPPNLRFEIEDFNSPWPYAANHFCYIYIRELFGCVADWDGFLAQAFAHTRPGGYVEITEHSVWPVSDDGTVDEDSFYSLWGRTVVECGEKFGKSFTIWRESKRRLEEAGFVDVVEHRFKWPVNEWPSAACRTDGNDGGKSWKQLRELGVWNQLRLYNGVEGFMLRLLTTVGGVCVPFLLVAFGLMVSIVDL